VEDFDYSQRLAFNLGLHARNVQISVRASEDSALISQAKPAQLLGKDRKVLLEGLEPAPGWPNVRCSIQ
jgi:hypothetical protein